MITESCRSELFPFHLIFTVFRFPTELNQDWPSSWTQPACHLGIRGQFPVCVTSTYPRCSGRWGPFPAHWPQARPITLHPWSHPSGPLLLGPLSVAITVSPLPSHPEGSAGTPSPSSALPHSSELRNHPETLPISASPRAPGGLHTDDREGVQRPSRKLDCACTSGDRRWSSLSRFGMVTP